MNLRYLLLIGYPDFDLTAHIKMKDAEKYPEVNEIIIVKEKRYIVTKRMLPLIDNWQDYADARSIRFWPKVWAVKLEDKTEK